MSLTQRRKSLAGAFVLALGGALLAVACGSTPEPAGEPPVETPAETPTVADATLMAPTVPPAVSVNALMVSSIDHAGHVIWDAGVEPPASDEDWLELEYHAIQLAGMGTLISVGGSGPADPGWARLPDWKRYAQELADEGVAALEAARSRNAEAITTIGDNLVATCEGCHKQFKPELPTEGLVHTPHYPR